MAAGIVYHDITTAAGVTFSIACWVPDTALPNAGAIPVSLQTKTDGTIIDLSSLIGTTNTSVAALGATTGAKVITDANGTIQQYLRGLISQWIAGTLVLGAGTNNIGDVDVVSLPALAAGTNAIGGVKILNDAETVVNPIPGVADDAVDIGDSVAVGGIAKSDLSSATLVAAGDRLKLRFALDGPLFVRNVPLLDIVSGNASNTDGTSTSVIAAAGAGMKQYLTRISLSNTHASTVALVDIKSGTTIKWGPVTVPPGGREIPFDTPLPPNAANEAWNFDPQAAVTTLHCSMVGFKSKV